MTSLLHLLSHCPGVILDPIYYRLLTYRFFSIDCVPQYYCFTHVIILSLAKTVYVVCEIIHFLSVPCRACFYQSPCTGIKKYLVGSWSSERIRRTTSEWQVTLKFDQLTQITYNQPTISASLWLHETYEAKDANPLRRKAGKRILEIIKLRASVLEKDFHYFFCC